MSPGPPTSKTRLTSSASSVAVLRCLRGGRRGERCDWREGAEDELPFEGRKGRWGKAEAGGWVVVKLARSPGLQPSPELDSRVCLVKASAVLDALALRAKGSSMLRIQHLGCRRHDGIVARRRLDRVVCRGFGLRAGVTINGVRSRRQCASELRSVAGPYRILLREVLEMNLARSPSANGARPMPDSSDLEYFNLPEALRVDGVSSASLQPHRIQSPDGGSTASSSQCVAERHTTFTCNCASGKKTGNCTHYWDNVTGRYCYSTCESCYAVCNRP